MVLTLADADGGLARPPLPEHPFPHGPSEAQPLAILPGELPFALWKASNKAQPAPLPHLRLILPNHPCSRASQCGESWTAVETRALAPGLCMPPAASPEDEPTAILPGMAQALPLGNPTHGSYFHTLPKFPHCSQNRTTHNRQ